MLIPPDAAAAQPPPSLAAAAAPSNRRGGAGPEPLDPELEARLRRQRAQQYGRAVRDSLAAWHARHAAERAAAAEEQRERWEAQRQARLARLSARQQQMQQQQEQRAANVCPLPTPKAGPTLQPPAVKLPVRPAASSPARPQHTPAGRGPHAQQRQQQRQASSPVQQPAVAPSIAATPSSFGTAAAGDDPLSGLLAELLAAEAGGDPYSIITLFVQEQLALQQPAAAAAQPAAGFAEAPAPPAGASSSWPADPQRAQPVQQQQKAPACGGDQPAAGPAVVPGVGSPPSHADALEKLACSPAAAAAATTVFHRHRRSNSMLLPQLDEALACLSDAAAPAAESQPGRPAQLLGPVAQQLPPPAWSASGTQPASADLAAAAAPPPPPPQLLDEEQQRVGADPGKQHYVQQWLQAAEAPLAPASTSSAAYSADPEWDGAAAGAADPDASSLPSSLRAPLHAAAAAAQPDAEMHCAPAEDVGAAEAVAAAAPAAPPSSSRSASGVTGSRRPGAPLPPGSSSLLDGSTALSGSGDYGAAPARPLAHTHTIASPAAPSQAAAADESGEAGGEQAPAEWCSRGDSSSQGSELPQVLSFGQLQAAAGDAAGGAEPNDGGQSSPQDGSPAQLSFAAAACSPAAVALHGGAAAQQLSPAHQQQQQQQQAASQASSAYSSDFDSEAEISYGQWGSSPGGTPRPGPMPAAAEPASTAAEAPDNGAGAGSSRPGSPCMVSPRAATSPPGSAGQQRPRSPHHAALDDRYPGSPPGSPGSAQQRPASAASSAAGDRPGSPHSQDSSRPGSPALAAAEVSAVAPQQEDTVVVHSPAASGGSSAGSSGATERLLHDGGSPYAQLRFGADGAADPEAAATEAAADGAGSPQAPGSLGAEGSPPGTPVLASPGSPVDESCPGSARVEDDTVVQSEEHVRGYLAELMAHFGGERAEGFAAGTAPPLDLEGYLAQERRRAPCGDPQHIYNKLLFDAAAEALAAHHAQALASYTGRLAPRLALLSPELLDRHVVQRVLRWAGMGDPANAGDCGGAGLGAMLAEDALEEERALSMLTAGMQAELAAREAAGELDAEGSGAGDEAPAEGQPAEAPGM